jgi:hypothetical protein
VQAVLVAAAVPAAQRLVLLVVLGFAVYVPCCVWRAPEAVLEIRGVIRRRAGKTAPRVETVEAPL